MQNNPYGTIKEAASYFMGVRNRAFHNDMQASHDIKMPSIINEIEKDTIQSTRYDTHVQRVGEAYDKFIKMFSEKNPEIAKQTGDLFKQNAIKMAASFSIQQSRDSDLAGLNQRAFNIENQAFNQTTTVEKALVDLQILEKDYVAATGKKADSEKYIRSLQDRIIRNAVIGQSNLNVNTAIEMIDAYKDKLEPNTMLQLQEIIKRNAVQLQKIENKKLKQQVQYNFINGIVSGRTISDGLDPYSKENKDAMNVFYDTFTDPEQANELNVAIDPSQMASVIGIAREENGQLTAAKIALPLPLKSIIHTGIVPDGYLRDFAGAMNSRSLESMLNHSISFSKIISARPHLAGAFSSMKEEVAKAKEITNMYAYGGGISNLEKINAIIDGWTNSTFTPELVESRVMYARNEIIGKKKEDDNFKALAKGIKMKPNEIKTFEGFRALFELKDLTESIYSRSPVSFENSYQTALDLVKSQYGVEENLNGDKIYMKYPMKKYFSENPSDIEHVPNNKDYKDWYLKELEHDYLSNKYLGGHKPTKASAKRLVWEFQEIEPDTLKPTYRVQYLDENGISQQLRLKNGELFFFKPDIKNFTENVLPRLKLQEKQKKEAYEEMIDLKNKRLEYKIFGEEDEEYDEDDLSGLPTEEELEGI